MSREMKDSGVEWIGEIPSDITLINTKFLLTYQKGKNPLEINSDGIGLPYIGASDLDNNSENYRYKNYCSEDLPKASKEDVLILWDGARAGLIGTGHEGYISSTIVKMNSKSDLINQRFWWWYLKGMQPVLYDWVGGTTIPHMNRNFVYDLKFVNLDMNKQLKIAMILDEEVPVIDRIIERTKSTIEDYKRLKQSIITEAVTKGLDKNVEMKECDLIGVENIPTKWNTITLKRIAYIRYGLGQPPATSDEGLPIIRATNVHAGIILEDNMIYAKLENIKTSKDVILNEGDLIVVRSGVYTGDIGYIDSKWAGSLGGYDMVVSIKNNHPKFIMYSFLSTYLLDNQIFLMRMRAAQPHLNAEELGNVKVILPNFSEQNEIVSYLDKKCLELDSLISQKERLIEDLEKYKKSLIYEYVTGKKEVE